MKGFLILLTVCCVLVAAASTEAAPRLFRNSCTGATAAPAPQVANTDHAIYWLTAALTLGAAGLSAVQCVRSTYAPTSAAKPKS